MSIAPPVGTPYAAPALPEHEGVDRGRLSLTGDGSPEANRLRAAAAVEWSRAVATLEARFPGIDVEAMARRSGLDTARVLTDATSAEQRRTARAAVDRFARRGDLTLPRAGLVEPNDPNTHPLPAGLLTREPPDQTQKLDPFLGRRAIEAVRTLVFNTMEGELDDDTHDVVEHLAIALRSQVQVNAYLSRGVAPGFGLHWDDHDVLVTQLEGRKYWEVHHPAQIGAVRHFVPDDEIGPVAWSGILEPGYALWIPRGWSHAVKGFDGESSVHLTFGVKRAPLFEILALADPSVTTAGRFDPAAFEHAVGDWRSRVVALPRVGPIAASEAVDRAFVGMRLDATLLGGTIFALDHTDEDHLGIVANRRLVRVRRPDVEVLAALIERAAPDVESLRVRCGDVDLEPALLRLGELGLLRLQPTR
jgi:hypothetical protein